MLTMFAGVTVWYRPDGPLSPEDVSRRYARYALGMVEAAGVAAAMGDPAPAEAEPAPPAKAEAPAKSGAPKRSGGLLTGRLGRRRSGR
jgi:hypothetical protein